MISISYLYDIRIISISLYKENTHPCLFWHQTAFPGSYGHENKTSRIRNQFSIDLDDQNQALYGQNKHL